MNYHKTCMHVVDCGNITHLPNQFLSSGAVKFLWDFEIQVTKSVLLIGRETLTHLSLHFILVTTVIRYRGTLLKLYFYINNNTKKVLNYHGTETFTAL